MPKLTIDNLKREAKSFSDSESHHNEKSLFGVTDGKAVGTYLEHKFKRFLQSKYDFETGSSASGIDFPSLQVDMMAMDLNLPHSSYPFKLVRQKIYGLSYSILLFVYDKKDEIKSKTAILNISHALFLDSDRTSDFRTTTGLKVILENNGNKDDLVAFMLDNFLFEDETEAGKLAEEILFNPPLTGYLGISDSVRWNRQYTRAIKNGDELVYQS